MTGFVYIDDDPPSREVMNVLLWHVVRASHVVIYGDAVDVAGRVLGLSFVPDAVFLDIHMRPVSGLEAIAALRACPTLADTRIVAVTASLTSDEVDRLRGAGFDALIAKPLSMHTFPEAVRRILAGESVWMTR